MVAVADVEAVVEPGEALRYHAVLRSGGRVGITDERVIVVRADRTTSIHLGTIAGVTIQRFDWFLGLLSAVLVGFGLLSFDRSLVGGAVFVAFGLASLYWTYRKRGQVQIQIYDRRKPVTFSLDGTEEFHAALGTALEPFRADPPTATARDA